MYVGRAAERAQRLPGLGGDPGGDAHGVEHRRCGKLIVATSAAQRAQLDRIRAQAAGNGVLISYLRVNALIATLAIVERAGSAEDIWNASCLDELWQEELWGADHWAQKNRNDRAGEFMAAVRFLDLLTPGM